MNKKGFTLTELLAVIAIIAILSVAAISGFSTMTRNSKQKAYVSKVKDIENAAYKYAKENNVSKKTTISVNKLVVTGYLQPDESSDEGLSVLNNPVNNSNMICNTIDIIVKDNDINAKYNEKKVDCSLSNEEADSALVGVTAYCSSSPSRNITLRGDTFDWVRCDKVFVKTNPTGTLNVANIDSVIFDYDGNSIINKDGTFASQSTNPTRTDGFKNVMYIEGVPGQIVNADVGITYNMKDGKTYYRHVVVRIDKEKPTATFIARNDLIKKDNVVRKVDVYVDDGNGSGSQKFVVTGPGTNITKNTDYKGTVEVKTGTFTIVPIDKVGNEGEPISMAISNIPEGLSCDVNVLKTDETPFSSNYSYNWYNADILIKLTSPKTYKNGTDYDIVEGTITNRRQLTQYLEKDKVLNYSKKYTAEMEKKHFYGGLRNLQSGQDIETCHVIAGIDKTKPKVTLSINSSTTYKKKHKVVVTIKDTYSGVNSGFDSGKTYELSYAWVKSTDAAPTIWDPANMTVSENKKELTATIDVDKDVHHNKMTGTYKLYIKGGSVTDLAQNNNESYTSGEFKLDNTPPECVSDGGDSAWTNGTRTLTGTCTDIKGTTDQAGCIKKSIAGYTYDDDGNVSKKYDAEIDSTTESPGVVYDGADNSTPCPDNQTVKIDRTKPTCATPTGQNSSWKTGSVTISAAGSDNKSSVTFNPPTATWGGPNHTYSTATYTYTITDEASNPTTCTPTVSVYHDSQGPTTPTGGAIGALTDGTNPKSVGTPASGSTDAGVGVDGYRYIIKANNDIAPANTDSGFVASSSFTRSCGTKYHAWAIAVDKLGNRSGVKDLGSVSDGVDSYSGWTTCSKACNGGNQKRTNTCLLQPTLWQRCNEDKQCCGDDNEVTSGDWYDTDASDCNATCGTALTKDQAINMVSKWDSSISCGVDEQEVSCGLPSCTLKCPTTSVNISKKKWTKTKAKITWKTTEKGDTKIVLQYRVKQPGKSYGAWTNTSSSWSNSKGYASGTSKTSGKKGSNGVYQFRLYVEKGKANRTCKVSGTYYIDTEKPKKKKITNEDHGCPPGVRSVIKSAYFTDNLSGLSRSNTYYYIRPYKSQTNWEGDGGKHGPCCGSNKDKEWDEGLCSGWGALYFEWHICDRAGNCGSGSASW